MTDSGSISSMEAEFFTEHFVVRGVLTSPDLRLSDHLNSATETFEVLPLQVHRPLAGARLAGEGKRTYITKAHLLFVLPDREVPGTDVAQAHPRVPTQTRRCLVGLGRHTLRGHLHVDGESNPRLFLRAMEHRKFIPLTGVEVTFPDGSMREAPAAIVNRSHIELLTILSEND